jgi:hypothetical protein
MRRASMVGFALLNPPYELRTSPNPEIGFDVGGQWFDGRFEPIRDLRGGFSGVAVPEAGDVGAGMCAAQDVVEFSDPAGIGRLRVKQLMYEAQMVAKVVALHEIVGCEKPNSGASAQLSRVRPGDEFLAFAVGAGRRDRQDRRDFPRVEIVAGKAQRHERLAAGWGVNLHRGGCQAARPAHR